MGLALRKHLTAASSRLQGRFLCSPTTSTTRTHSCSSGRFKCLQIGCTGAAGWWLVESGTASASRG